METTHTILDLAHIGMKFGDAVALADVTLDVRPGEIYVVLGESGSGTVTLFKILAGLHRAGAYSGEIRVAGQPVIIRSPQDALRCGIGIVPRHSGIFGKLTVAENVTIGSWQSHGGFVVRQQAIALQARAILEMLDLKLEPGIPASRLSTSQQRLLMIARALAINPKIVIFNEPAAALSSPNEVSQLIRAIRMLAEHDIASLYLTRRPVEALQIADRVSVLRDGRLNGTWVRADLNESTLALAMTSQRVGDGGYVDSDEPEARGGLFGSLSSLFGFGNKRD